MPMITLHHYSWSLPILAVAMLYHNLQQVGINPEYEKLLTRLTRHKPEIMTPRSMQGFLSVG
jgi:hypothetical protein